MKNHFKQTLKQIVISCIILTLMLWTIGDIAFNLKFSPALADTTINVSTSGLFNGDYYDRPIGATSSPYAILRLELYPTVGGPYKLATTTVIFSGNNFSPTTTLASLSNSTSSGVALYRDNGSNSYYYDSSDTQVTMSPMPTWVSTSTGYQLEFSSFNTPSQVNLPSSTWTYFFVVIRTAGTAVNNTQIRASIYQDGITTTDTAYPGPNNNFHSNPYLVDTVGPSIVSVEPENDYSVMVRFNEDIEKSTAENLSDYSFNNTAVSNVNAYSFGPNEVKVVATGTIQVGATTLTVSSSITDLAGNANLSTSPFTVSTSSAGVVISEFSASVNGSGDEYVELYNESDSPIEITNWEVQWSSSTPLNWVAVANAPSTPTYIQPFSFYLFGTNGFNFVNTTDRDFYSTNEFSLSGGHIRIFDTNASVEVDKAAWGSAVSPEGAALSSLQQYYCNERKAFGDSTAGTMAPGAEDALMGNSFDSNDNYFDFVTHNNNANCSPQNSSSASEQPSGGSLTEPMIEHAYINFAPTGSDLSVFARMGDPQDSPDQISTYLYYMAGDGYKDDNVASDYTWTSGDHQGQGFYKFTIPSFIISNGQSSGYGIHYFFKMESSGGTTLLGGNPSINETGIIDDIAKHPFDAYCAAEGTTYTLSGQALLAATTTHSGILVIVEGSGYYGTTTASGNYSLSVPAYNTYSLVLVKDEYFVEFIDDIYVNSDKTLNSRTLSTDSYGGFSGDSVNPYVNWTGPPDGDTGVPAGDSSFKILVGFSKDIDSSTFSTSTVIIATSSINNAISGYTVEYNPINRDSWMPTVSEDPYLGVITAPSGGFNLGTTYYLVLTGNVRDASGNSLQGNRSDGGHEIQFTTAYDYSSYNYGSGAYMPPFVMDVKPYPGALDVQLNKKLTVFFSESMDNTTIDMTDSTTGNIKLYKVDIVNNVEQATAVSISAELDTTKKIAIITPIANLSASQKYRIIVTGALESSAGICMDSTCSSSEVYRSGFKTGSTLDTTRPTVVGTWPANNATGISVNPGSLYVQFSESLSPSSVNSNTVTLKRGTSLMNTEIIYDAMAESVYITPKVVLVTDANYTLTLTGSSTGIKDMANNALASDNIITFTTGSSYDSVAPEIMYANGDDYGIAISFSEAMISAKQTDTTNWPASVLRPSNYTIKWGDPSTVVNSGTSIDLSNAQFYYDTFDQTVFIENLGLDSAAVSGYDFYIDMSAGLATDLSGNYIASSSYNTFQMPIQDSMDTYGMLGPSSDGISFYDMDSMGMMMAGAFPMNTMANQTTVYFIDVPTMRAIPAGGKITITFPDGFDVSGAKKDTYSPINNDINDWNEGVVIISKTESSGGANDDGVEVDTATNKISITTAGTSTQAYDFLHFDIAGITNPAIPRGYETSGYTVDIKTYNASSTLLETITAMPIYITAGGQINLKVNITGINAADVSGNDDYVSVFLGSPMTGPMDKQVLVDANGIASTTFTGLPSGEYSIFTEPSYTLDGNGYYGMPMPEPLYLTSSTTKNIAFTKENSGSVAAITVEVNNITTGDDVDVFAGGPNSFKVKTLTNVVGNTSATLYLSDGTWWIGIGPAMPENPMSGPPPMPDWMPPMPVEVIVSGGGTTVRENSGTVNDSTVTFNISVANKNIIGYVKTESGVAISDAEVWAYQPMGAGMGANTKTDTNGKFTLKVADTGNYKVGAYKPGLPYVSERSIVVKTNASDADSNTTADIYRETGTIISTGVPFVIKIKKPSYTISGRATDGTNPVAYAPVWADQADGYGHADTVSDSTGNYIIYVDNGTWMLNAYIPGYGDADTETVAVDGANETQNLAPALNTTYISISGTVSDGSPLTYLPIRAVQFDDYGYFTGKEYGSQTDSTGAYTISVPTNKKYRVDIWTPEYGEVGLDTDEVASSPANLIATTTNRTNRDITINTANLRTITLSFTNGQSSQEGYVNIDGMNFSGGIPYPTDFHKSLRVSDLSATTSVRLADGDYFFFLDVPGFGSYIPNTSDRDGTKDDIVVSLTDRSVTFTLPQAGTSTAIISGEVTDGTDPVADAWVWIVKQSTGYHNGVQTAADGTYSMTVPKDSDYKMGADKPGFMSAEPTDVDVAGATTQNFTLTSSNITISGYLYNNSSQGVPAGFARAETIQCNNSDLTDDANCKKSHVPADGSGYYELPVVNGTWKVYGMADGYQETYYGTTIPISGSDANANITLTENSNWTNKSKAKPITPASGGSVDDTTQSTTTGASLGTGVKLTFPPNALGNDSSAGNVNTTRTSAVTETNSSEPVGNEGVNITATDYSGQSINNTNDYFDIELVLYKQDIETASSVTPLTKTKLKTTQLGYWDSTVNDWVYLATTKTAYYKTAGNNEWKLYSNTTASSSFNAFIESLPGSYSDYKLVFKAKSNHLTVFAVIMPYVATPASASPPSDPPAPPTGGGGGAPTTYCTEVEYEDWQECIAGWQYRNVLSTTPSGCTLTTDQQNDRKQECSLEVEGEEEKLAYAEDAPEITLISADELYLSEAQMITRAEVDEIMPALEITERNHEGESLSRGTLANRLGIDLNALEPRYQYALTNFITYGSPNTAWLGWGERAGVLNSFMAAFGEVPVTELDWQDIVKIANGRWTNQRSQQAETRANSHFMTVYLREPDRTNPHDDAAVTVIAYGLRPKNRNLESEAAAIKIYRAIFNNSPSGATDWDIVRAIAYSGAVR